MIFELTVELNFCYGHRLLNYQGNCRHLHGHNGIVQISIEGTELDERGMIMDFKDIKAAMKSWIDTNLDHKMILNANDPAIKYFQELNEPMFLMDCNPTAEAIALLIANAGIDLGFPVKKVTLWETPTSKVVVSV